MVQVAPIIKITFFRGCLGVSRNQKSRTKNVQATDRVITDCQSLSYPTVQDNPK